MLSVPPRTAMSEERGQRENVQNQEKGQAKQRIAFTSTKIAKGSVCHRVRLQTNSQGNTQPKFWLLWCKNKMKTVVESASSERRIEWTSSKRVHTVPRWRNDS